MLPPKKLTPISEITKRSFLCFSVVTKKSKFDFYHYDGVERCNLINYSHEFECHIFTQLSVNVVDGKPLYFIETKDRDGVLLCSESFRTIKEVKNCLNKKTVY